MTGIKLLAYVICLTLFVIGVCTTVRLATGSAFSLFDAAGLFAGVLGSMGLLASLLHK